jgi:hypothetical protein
MAGHKGQTDMLQKLEVRVHFAGDARRTVSTFPFVRSGMFLLSKIHMRHRGIHGGECAEAGLRAA